MSIRKKILILSNQIDETVDETVNFLNYYNADHIRLTSNIFRENKINILNDEFIIVDNIKIFFNEITTVWLRYWNIEYGAGNCFDKDEKCWQIVKNMNNEINIYNNYFFSHLERATWYNHYKSNSIDKLMQIKYAEKAGLQVPEFIITSSKNELINFHKKFNIITKTVLPILMIETKKGNLYSYTELVNGDDVKNLENNFPLSFFQKAIAKELELRVSFFDSNIYATAIIPTTSKNNDIDIRHYDKNSYYYVPYKLPKSIENNIIKFMTLTGLRHGQLDFVLSKEGIHYFLEVNPVGEFLGNSIYCNYNLAEKCAISLINK